MVKGKIKVLFVLLQVNRGGAETVVLELARNLPSKKYETFVAYFSGGALVKDFKNICTGVYRIDKKPGFDISAIKKLNKIIRINKIHYVNAHHYAAFFYSFWASINQKHSKLVYTEHSVAELERLNTFYNKLSQMMFYGTNSIIAVSEEIAQEFIAKFPAHKRRVVCIPNGVDIEKIKTCKESNHKFRLEYGIGQNEIIIGCVANFRRVKNHILLIKAFDRVKKKIPHIKLVLVGTGFSTDIENTEQYLIQTIEKLGLKDSVIFTGYREDVYVILHNFVIFCLPSLSEGLPVAVIEAMAAGVPVVGSNVRGIREVVINGVTGMLFKVNDEKALAEALMSLLRDPDKRVTISKNALRYVKEKHSLNSWIEKYDKIIQKNIIKKREKF